MAVVRKDVKLNLLITIAGDSNISKSFAMIKLFNCSSFFFVFFFVSDLYIADLFSTLLAVNATEIKEKCVYMTAEDKIYNSEIIDPFEKDLIVINPQRACARGL